MKLRQRLAMMLATAMITTSIPMVAFANNTSLSQTLVLKKGNTVGYTDEDDTEDTEGNITHNNITVDDSFKQLLTFNIDIGITDSESIEVYLEGDNIKFDETAFNHWAHWATTGGNIAIAPEVDSFTMNNFYYGSTPEADTGTITVKRIGENDLIITLTGFDNPDYGPIKQFRMPLLYRAEDGDLKLKVTSYDGRIEEGTYALSKESVGDKNFTAEIHSGPIISVEGDGHLGDIEITEVVKNSFNSDTYTDSDDDAVFRITLDSSDLIFNDEYNSLKEVTVEDETYGLISRDIGAEFIRSEEDEKVGYLIFEAPFNATAPGGLKVKDIAVEAEDDDVSTGDVDITLELMKFDEIDRTDFNDLVDNSDTELTWDDVDTADESGDMEPVDGVSAEVKEDGISMSVENEADVFGGKYDYDDDDDHKVTLKFSDPTKEYLQDEGKVTITLEGATFAPVPAAEYIKNSKDGEDFADEDAFYTKIESNDNNKIDYDVPDDLVDEKFVLIDESSPNVAEFDLQNLDDADNLEISFYVVGNPGSSADIKAIVDGSKWDDPMIATVGEVAPPTRVKLVQPITVVENEKAYPGGLITITETDERMFQADDIIAFKIEDLDIEDAEVTADNSMEIDSQISNGHLLIQVQRRSNNPATITISDIRIDGSGYVPVGEYDAYIGGQGMHIANTKLNFEESSSSKLLGIPDDADDWEDNWDDYKNNEVNLEDFDDDIEEIFAAAFALDGFFTSTRPVEPEPEPLPEPEPVPEPDPIPQPDDVKGEDGNYGLPNLDIRISNGRATVNGKYAQVASEPQLVDGVTMVGVADLAKLLGIPRDKEEGNTLNYLAVPGQPALVTLKLDKRRILEIEIGSYAINIYDYDSLTGTYKPVGKKDLVKPAQILPDNEGLSRTFVPMRPIGEALGFKVDWNAAKSEAIFSNLY